MAWIRTTDQGVVIQVRVVPRASRNETVGEHGDALKIRLCAPPVDGKANAALLDYLAETLRMPARSLQILSGETGRQKRVAIRGLCERDVRSRLGA